MKTYTKKKKKRKKKANQNNLPWSKRTIKSILLKERVQMGIGKIKKRKKKKDITK